MFDEYKEGDNYEMVDSPKHYNNYAFEVFDMIEKVYGEAILLLWGELTAFKYRMRLGTKPGNPTTQDLLKENVYLGKKNEILGHNGMTREDFQNFIKDVNEVFKKYSKVQILK